MAEFCRGLAISHLTLNWRGDKPKTGLSEAARNARYRLWPRAPSSSTQIASSPPTRWTTNSKPSKCGTGAATMGQRGLSGIAPAALFFGRLAVHRPFLRVRRSDIRAHLSGRRHPVV